MLDTFDNSYLTFIAIQAALRGGDILLKGFGKDGVITSKPGHQNIVTEYDHASEKAIISLIESHFPTHAFLAEESGKTKETEDTILWIIDPLDGTTNFARQIPIFTISIAAYYKEQALCGVIYQPCTNELFVAERGKGAYLNGKRLHVSSVSKLNETIIGIGSSYEQEDKSQAYMNRFTNLLNKGASYRNLGSAAIALAYVAAGKLDAFWIDFLYPWDVAAGKLLVEEAGGSVSLYKGTQHQTLCNSEVLASNSLIHNEIVKYL